MVLSAPPVDLFRASVEAGRTRRRRRNGETERQRRRALIEAVFNCVLERGVNNTTTEAIARSAGVSKGVIHYYFRDKLELFQAAFATVLEDQVQYWRRRVSPDSSAAEQLTELIYAGLPMTEEGAKRARFWFQFMASSFVEPSLMRLHQESFLVFQQQVEDFVTRLRSDGQLTTPLPPSAVAQAILSFVDGLALRLVSQPPDAVGPIEDTVQAFVGCLVGATPPLGSDRPA